LNPPAVHIATHGCRTNTSDSSALARALVRLGFRIAEEPEGADVIVVNSCTVTGGADRDAGKALRRARREAPTALIVLAGCLPVAFPDHPAVAEADLVLPGADAQEGARRIADELSWREGNAVSGPSTAFPLEEAMHLSRFNLKIQEGCAGGCAYCIVPTARGKPRSRPAPDVLAELTAATTAGFEEIVLSGTNLLSYRWNPRKRGEAEPTEHEPVEARNASLDLAGLMVLLDRDAPHCHLRLSSLEPQAGMERVVELLAASPRWCRHLHLSLQHADDEVLAAMGRPYRFAAVEEVVRDAHRRIPLLSVGMDVIVGFPTETDSQFRRCLERLQGLSFAYLHVFAWSPRPGTRAAVMSPLDAGVVKERSAALRALSDSRRSAFSASLAGQSISVLIERRRDDAGRLIGLTDNYVQVAVEGPDEWMRRVVPCRMERGPGGRLLGRIQTCSP